ncbi:MAG TPA: hypothetical protein VGF99_16885, partial [Myxococcota bacterium]
MDRIEAVVGLGAAVVGAVTAVMLVVASERRLVPSRFATLLLSLSAALSLRALDHAAHHPLLSFAAFAAFAFFPLAAALFIEAALPAGLPLPLKVVLLLGVVGIPIASAVPGVIDVVGFWMAVAVWQLLVFGALVVFLVWRVAIATTPTARATPTALLVGCVLASITLGNDWAGALGLGTPQIGAALTVVVFYVVGEALFADERFQLRPTLARLLVVAGAAVVVAALLFASGAMRADSDSVVVVALVLFFIGVAALPLRTVLQHTRRRSADTIELRLAALPTSSWPTFFAALSHWPELRTVRLLTPQQQRDEGFDTLGALLGDVGHVVDRVDLARVGDVDDARIRRAAEQGRH